jgi:multiple antibiotic resistance protein
MGNFDIWINAFLAFFAILNPIGNIPLFMEIVEDLDQRARFKIFNIVVSTGFLTLLTMTITGKWIMERIFQIDILEFRIAGGILLTVLSVKYIVFPKKETGPVIGDGDHHAKAMEMGVVPMAVPLLVGPGSIVTGILILDRDGYAVTISSIVAVFLLSWAIFQASPLISRMMGKIGRLVVGRILWIFIGAIGVHFLISGIRQIFGI